jgi:hypothetical protein
MPMGFAPGSAERNWAHPAMARPTIPITILRFMSENISILGEFRPDQARDSTLKSRPAQNRERPAILADLCSMNLETTRFGPPL